LLFGKPIDVPIIIGVVGKTPAKKVTGDMKAELLEGGQRPDFSYAKGISHMHLPEILILPETDTHIVLRVVRRNPHGSKSEPVIHSEIIGREIENGDLVIVYHGKLTYDDVLGVSHWIKFCQVAGGSAPSTKSPVGCNEYNQIDDK